MENLCTSLKGRTSSRRVGPGPTDPLARRFWPLTCFNQRRHPGCASAPRRPPRPLALLAEGVEAGLALLPGCERRRGGAALLLILVVLGLRLLLFLVASHLTFRHGVLPAGCR